MVSGSKCRIDLCGMLSYVTCEWYHLSSWHRRLVTLALDAQYKYYYLLTFTYLSVIVSGSLRCHCRLFALVKIQATGICTVCTCAHGLRMCSWHAIIIIDVAVSRCVYLQTVFVDCGYWQW